MKRKLGLLKFYLHRYYTKLKNLLYYSNQQIPGVKGQMSSL